MKEELYTVQEVADYFKVSRAAIWKWIRQGKLGYVYVGSERRVPESAVKQFVRSAEQGPLTDSDTTPENPMSLANASA